MEPSPKTRSYWDSFIDADIPLWERALDGALLPIALVTSLAGSLAGCSQEDPPSKRPSRGEDPPSNPCAGAAASRTTVDFKEGYVSDPEKPVIQKWLERDESVLRALVPRLFCQFNGWEITNDLDGAAAYYGPDVRKVFVPKSLAANLHEFCHYLSHRRALVEGKTASETAEWGGLSCFLTHRYEGALEGCVDHKGNLLRGAEEEFANVCAPAVANPLGALLTYASEPRTLEQIRYVLGVMEIPIARVEDVAKNILRPPQPVEISGQMETVRLPIPLRIQNPSILRPGEGVVGYLLDASTFRFFSPVEGAQGWALGDLRAPSGFAASDLYSVAFQAGIFALRQNGILYTLSQNDIGTRNPAGEDLWQRSDMDDALQGPGTLAFLDKAPVFFKDTGYWSSNSGNSSLQNYPQRIEAEIRNSDSWAIQESEGHPYFWISGMPHASGKVSRLYQLEWGVGALNFRQVLEIPTPVTGSVPQNYRGQWYLIERVNNADLTPSVPDFVNGFIQPLPPVLLRLEEGGRKITPLKLLYPSGDPLALFIGMSTVRQDSWMISGSRFVGLAKNQWNAQESSLLFSPAFLSFELPH